jgi:protein-S-isoprenylcysteine O-methyltransferase Ste14
MWAYLICAIIWIFFLGILIPERKGKRIVSEIYGHCGMSFILTSLVLGIGGVGIQHSILLLKIIGFILYIPAVFLIVYPTIALKRKGKPRSKDFTTTTSLVTTGIYRIVRHPMSLGMVIGAIGLMLTFQSILSIILGVAAIFCLYIYSKKEDSFNIEQFGDSYKEYMKKVPMWNIIRGLRK